jgi:hypothetical protein
MTAISRWINRAGFEPQGGCGFVLCVRELKGSVYSTSSIDAARMPRLKSGANMLNQNGRIQCAPRFSPYLLTDY